MIHFFVDICALPCYNWSCGTIVYGKARCL
nr:MAG TPA: hypothetical protein [Caudoviricetes sp.]